MKSNTAANANANANASSGFRHGGVDIDTASHWHRHLLKKLTINQLISWSIDQLINPTFDQTISSTIDRFLNSSIYHFFDLTNFWYDPRDQTAGSLE